MSAEILIERDGFTVKRTGEEPVPYPVKPQSKLPRFVALVLLASPEGSGCPAREVARSAEFRHVVDDNFIRMAKKYISDLAKLFENASDHLRVELVGAGRIRRLRVVRSPDTTVKVSKELAAYLQQEEVRDTESSGDAPRAHNLLELKIFVRAIARAAREFDKGHGNVTKTTVTAATDAVHEPRYRAVLHFRLVRACLRLGDDEGARHHVRLAQQFANSMTPRDPILIARGDYNNVWIGYTEGDFGDDLIHRARASLAVAGPDDIRHGYVATQHGLVILKQLERGVPPRSIRAIAEKYSEALRYLAHAVYLLTRSEDFWGAQESCWNLAYGLYIATQLPEDAFALKPNLDEALAWIDVSDDVAKGHDTGKDSVRNHVLRATIAMTCGKLDAALTHLTTADDAVLTTTTARERGRLKERWLHYHLLLAEKEPQRKSIHLRHAVTAHREAKEIWTESGLVARVKSELNLRYRKRGSTITKKGPLWEGLTGD